MESPCYCLDGNHLRRSRRIAKTFKAVLDNAELQNQSPFFQCLSAELRLIIYAFVFPNQTVYIMTQPGRLPGLTGWLWELDPGDEFRRMRPLIIGGIFRACRLLYFESALLLYTNTPFGVTCDTLNVFCKAISVNQQFTPPPLMFVRDIRISVPDLRLRYIKETNAGLRLLAEQAANLKKLKLVVLESRRSWRDTRADIWCGERRRLLQETLRILGSFRGLESFDLELESSPHVGHVLGDNEVTVITNILRELVFQPRGSGAMTTLQFHNSFKIRYDALMA